MNSELDPSIYGDSLNDIQDQKNYVDKLLRQKYQTNVPYTNKLGMGKEYEELMRLMEEYQKKIRIACRLCGRFEETHGPDIKKTKVDLCSDCLGKILSKIFDEVIATLIPKDNPNYCTDCWSHINACRCPKREALKKIKT
jgi:hypothetical protein